MDMSMSGSRFLAWTVDTKQTLLNHGWWISQLTRKSRCEQYQGRDPSLPDTTAQFTDSGFLALFSGVLHLPLVLSGGRMTSSWVQITEQQASSLMKRRVSKEQSIVFNILSSYRCLTYHDNHAFYVWSTEITSRLVSGYISSVDMFHVCFMSAMCAPWLHSMHSAVSSI